MDSCAFSLIVFHILLQIDIMSWVSTVLFVAVVYLRVLETEPEISVFMLQLQHLCIHNF